MDKNPKRTRPEQISNLTYRKQTLILKTDGSLQQNPLDKLTPSCCKGFTHYITLKKSFQSLSVVKINNTDKGVTLSKDGKIVDLNNALKKYFNKKYIINKKNTPDWKQLNNSKILALWCTTLRNIQVINKEGKPQEKHIEAQLIGLAKNKSGKLFHWTTDLNNDIEVLTKL